MGSQLWGISLLMLGLLVIMDGYIQYIQQQSGTMRWIYIALGVLLVIRGFYLWWPHIIKSKNK